MPLRQATSLKHWRVCALQLATPNGRARATAKKPTVVKRSVACLHA